MQNKLVSFLVPCYNGEKTISRLFDSLLMQTYTNLEVIVVDDGSKDGSAEIIKAYREKFQENGMCLVYFYQENAGLGAAIDAGLKLFRGDYLCWIDVDDFITPDSVELRVRFLEEHLEYGIVTSDANLVSAENLSISTGLISSGVTCNDDEFQFWHLLEANSIFAAGCHMVRTNAFLSVNPNRSIYPARRGQNWQMLLPVLYRFKRGFIEKPLFSIVVSENSMSRDHGDFEKEIYRCDEHEDIILQTLIRIEMKFEDRQKAERIVKVNYTRKRLYIAGKNGQKSLAKEQYAKLKNFGVNNKKDYLQLLCAKYSLIRKLYLSRKLK